MKTKTYAISGTMNVPEDVDIDDFLGKLHSVCAGKFKDVEIDIDQVDDITEDDDDED